MKCKRVRSQLELYLSGQLHPILEQEVKEHLLSCRLCQRELSALRKLNTRLEAQAFVQAPHGFTQNLMPDIVFLPLSRKASPPSYHKWGISFIAAGLVLLLLNMTPFISVLQPLPKKMNHQTTLMVSRFQSWSLKGFENHVTNGFYDLTDLLTRPVSSIHNRY